MDLPIKKASATGHGDHDDNKEVDYSSDSDESSDGLQMMILTELQNVNQRLDTIEEQGKETKREGTRTLHTEKNCCNNICKSTSVKPFVQSSDSSDDDIMSLPV